MLSTKCLGCYYYSGETQSCDFLLRTGMRRGCAPGYNCKRFKDGVYTGPRPLEKEKPAKPSAKAVKIREREAKCNQLWLEGMTDAQIAEELHCGVETVRQWRKKVGLPTQRERKINDKVQQDSQGD